MEEIMTQTFSQLRGSTSPGSKILAIGGGKGGVGKSFVSSSIAILLGKLGYDTVLVDLDLGSANLHTYLGESIGRSNLHDFLLEKSSSLEPHLIKTGLPRLRFLSGYSDQFQIADASDAQRSRLMAAIYNLKADFVILDLSAGNHSSTLDFFLMAQKQLVVITPDPSSIENAYGFIKAAYFRKVKRYEAQLGLSDLIDQTMDHRSDLGIRSPAQLMTYLMRQNPESGQQLKAFMEKLNVQILMNQVRTYKDIELGQSIRSVSAKYFGVPFGFMGHLEYDNAVWQALRKKRHLLLEFPHSRIYAQLVSMVRELANNKDKRALAG